MDSTAADRPPARKEAAAWRVMGDAFVKVLRDQPVDQPKRGQALKLAEWLYANVLTPDQQHDFMISTGWILDPKLAAELQGSVPRRPGRARKMRDEEIPF